MFFQAESEEKSERFYQTKWGADYVYIFWTPSYKAFMLSYLWSKITAPDCS